jgi:hypothetical protein
VFETVNLESLYFRAEDLDIEINKMNTVASNYSKKVPY